MRTRAQVMGFVLAAMVIPSSAPVPLAAPGDPASPGPTTVVHLEEQAPFFPGARYDDQVPTPEELLGFPIGRRAASHAEIERCLLAWDEASPRTRLVRYATSYEGRALYYMIVTSPANLERLDEIRAGIDRLADPRGLSQAEGDGLVDSLPAVAWLAYSIHGNESSGSDAALAVLHHLAASRDQEAERLLAGTIVLVDPMMNPDGRDRFVKQVAEARGSAPNLDDQSLLHEGYWPWGRMNHYLYDLNRDWILGVNPESRGRIDAAGGWHPLLFVDAHEMGAQDTYLFSPQREPTNPHRPLALDRWGRVFGRDQAEAFDRHRWPYYTGEWNEGWYPGYSDAWAGFRGAVGILYEQASVDEDGVRRPGGDVLTYREAVHHQVVSSMANLATLRVNARELKSEFLAGRREAVSAEGPYAKRTFVLLPTKNRTRLDRFLDLMQLQRVEVHVALDSFESDGVDQLGRPFRRRVIPEGAYLIPNRQPEAHLIAAMLEFDTKMPEAYLRRERRELLRTGQSTIYDQTAWNLTMLHGLEAVAIDSGLTAAAAPWKASLEKAPSPVEEPEGTIAWVIDGADDASVAAAARLMERGVQVRGVDKHFTFDARPFSRGSVVVSKHDNRSRAVDLDAIVAETAAELSLTAYGITEGLGEGELPDIGGRHFIRLEPPSIALLARGGTSPYEFGAIWDMLDRQFAIRHSHLGEEFLADADLRRYNVLVVPGRWFGALPDEAWTAIKSWVEAGGTLIATGGSSGAAASEERGLSGVRRLQDSLESLDAHELAVTREWLARTGRLPGEPMIWSHTASEHGGYPWDGEPEDGRPDLETLKKQDEWDRLFMPQGAIVAARTDDQHWLTFGCGEVLPVLYNVDHVLMAGPGIEAPVRAGVFMEKREGDPVGRFGWGPVPDGHEMRLRMSGLLWPEAARRIANGAWVTREPLGNGQVILFATAPVFRGATHGTARILANAMVFGPGMGASHPIRP